jgi:prevent-host-death family protein
LHISVIDAKATLTELVRRAEAGEEVILMRHGLPAVSLVPIKPVHDPEARRKLFEDLGKAAVAVATPGPCAARSQDFLYDEFGVPT